MSTRIHNLGGNTFLSVSLLLQYLSDMMLVKGKHLDLFIQVLTFLPPAQCSGGVFGADGINNLDNPHTSVCIFVGTTFYWRNVHSNTAHVLAIWMGWPCKGPSNKGVFIYFVWFDIVSILCEHVILLYLDGRGYAFIILIGSWSPVNSCSSSIAPANFMQTPVLVCRTFQLLLYLSGLTHPPSRARFSRNVAFCSVSIVWNSLWSQFIWPRRCSCLWCDVTCLLGCLLWKTSIWNMSSVLCLLLPFPLSCERCRDWWLFQMGHVLLAPDHSRPTLQPFWYPAICLSQSCLLCYPSPLLLHLFFSFIPSIPEDWELVTAAQVEIFV